MAVSSTSATITPGTDCRNVCKRSSSVCFSGCRFPSTCASSANPAHSTSAPPQTAGTNQLRSS
ncbi:MAG: hypothetical protein ACLT2C_02525 [Ruminococcus sp.]